MEYFILSYLQKRREPVSALFFSSNVCYSFAQAKSARGFAYIVSSVPEIGIGRMQQERLEAFIKVNIIEMQDDLLHKTIERLKVVASHHKRYEYMAVCRIITQDGRDELIKEVQNTVYTCQDAPHA